jgi:plastocyanin
MMRTRAIVAGLAVWILAVPRTGWGADDVEELKREVRALQAQVQALRAALAEAAELDKQKAAIIQRALKGGAPEAAAPAARSEAPAPKSAAPEILPPTARRQDSPPARKAAPAPTPPPAPEPTVGSVRGKVTVPGNEPVAYVYVENVLASPVKGQRVVIEQSGKKFIPGWAVVQRGTNVAFPNKDNIYHNVFSLSAGNSFDLGLYNAGSEAKSHTFSEAGAVDVYCNIHPQMQTSILVVPNRHYAKVKGDGTFELAGVPSGRRKVVAWAPGSRSTAEWIEVSPGAATDINLKLESKAAGHKNKAGQAYGSYE